MLICNVQCHSNPKETTGELVFTNHTPYMMYNCLWYKGSWLTLTFFFFTKENMHIYTWWEQDKTPPDKKPPDKKPSNNEIIIQSYYICFFIDGDIKRYFKELIQKIKYFKNIFFHILFSVMFIYKVLIKKNA